MTTVTPQSELMRKAVSWVSEECAKPGASLAKVLSEAGMRFNLSPNDQEFLKDFFKDAASK